ncbi:hypothetical protein LguiA_022334 [Lonicera macranthoides]
MDKTMENVLLEASMSGNIDTLKKLIQNDPLILDRVLATSFNENPLHIAVLRGHLDFVRILLCHKRELANALNNLRRSPLHLASGGGYIDIVRELIMINPEMCCICDCDGKIPLHFVAYREHVYIMDVLIEVKPELVKAIFDNNETLLHFCVKHNRTEALKVLVKWLGDIGDCAFVNTKDKHGNTILHLAIIEKQMQTINYLLSEGGVDGNALTEDGCTALDLLERYPRNFDSRKIREILTGANIKRAKDLNTTEELSTQSCSSKAKQLILMFWRYFLKSESRWFEEARGNLMVAATVIASMAFQAAVNPPGGVWQDSVKDDPNTSDKDESHTAGYSIAATRAVSSTKQIFKRPSLHHLNLNQLNTIVNQNSPRDLEVKNHLRAIYNLLNYTPTYITVFERTFNIKCARDSSDKEYELMLFREFKVVNKETMKARRSVAE